MLKIKNDKKNVVILGAGGTGSWLASFLSKLDHTFTIIDGDMVEAKNILRQNFSAKDINKSKAMSIGSRYNMSYIDSFISDTSTLEEIFDNSTDIPVIVGCLDNNASRKIVHDIFYSNKYSDFIWLDGGNAERYGQVYVAVKEDGVVKSKTPIDLDTAFQNYEGDERRPDQISCAEHSESAPQNVTANVTSAVLLFDILNIVLNGGMLLGNKYTFDTRTVGFSTETVK